MKFTNYFEGGWRSFLFSHNTHPTSLRDLCMVSIYIKRNPCCFCSSRYLLNRSVGVIFYLEFNIATHLPRNIQSWCCSKSHRKDILLCFKTSACHWFRTRYKNI